MKSYTDLKQSKKLTEILPLESADMYWDYDVQKHEHYPMVMDDQFDDTCVRAWSLAALLDVLPYKESLILAINDFQGDRKEKYVIGSVEHDKYDCYADNPVDACYELLLKLNEVNLL